MRIFCCHPIMLPVCTLLLLCLLWTGAVNALAAAETEGAGEPPLLQALKNRPASLRAENMRVALLLRGLGRQAGINIVVADKIDDTINVDVENLSMYEIFQMVMNAKQLRCYQKNNVVFVEKQADFKEDRDMITAQICTRFGNAASYLDQLTPLLTQHGSIMVSGRGNCLAIRDQADNIPRLRAMLADLDQPIPQVYIEARIVSITDEAKKRLGIIWGYNNFPEAAGAAGSSTLAAAADLAIVSPTTTLAFGLIRQNLDLNVTLQAMQSDNLLNILSSPRVLVLDGREAEIKQGKEVPFVTQSGDLINTSFREANLGLTVKPTVLQDGYVILDVTVTNDSVDHITTASGEAIINTQQISTSLFLEDKVTVVIGGILQQSRAKQNNKVPVLGDIPLLGNLFRNSSKLDDQSELMVFITPRIVSLPGKAVSKAQLAE